MAMLMKNQNCVTGLQANTLLKLDTEFRDELVKVEEKSESPEFQQDTENPWEEWAAAHRESALGITA
jgi:hypothetical protein